MSATDTTTSLPKWQIVLSVLAVVVPAIALVLLFLDRVDRNIEKRQIIEQSNYSFAIEDGALVLLSTDRSEVPSQIIVTPIFDTPVGHGDSEGAPNKPYEDLSPDPGSPDGLIKIVIPGVVREVCEYNSSNDELCKKKYPISEFKVETYFGKHLPPPEFVPNS